MFLASLYVCVAMNMQECLVLEDMRGPYETIELCQDRIHEMAAVALSVGHVPIRFRCSVVGEKDDPSKGRKKQAVNFIS